MPELRKDPVLGRWVIIATDRAKRPSSFVCTAPENPVDAENPFLPGKEKETPEEVLAYRPAGTKPNTPGWWVRVVPNKYPALDSSAALIRRGEGMYDLISGVGRHEVIIESPDPTKQIPDMDEEQVQEIIWAYRDRSVDIKRDPRFRYTQVFKNYGMQSGASFWHPHSQLIALPIVPSAVHEELVGAKKYYEYKERNVYLDVIHQEQRDKVRVVLENDQFICFCPYASRFPFEMQIMPKERQQQFSDVNKSAVTDLASILKGSLKKLQLALNDPAYNMIIRTTPEDEAKSPWCHWRIEILPALSRVAGFEWGSGFFINPVTPEDAAEMLRNTALPKPGAKQETLKARLIRESQEKTAKIKKEA